MERNETTAGPAADAPGWAAEAYDAGFHFVSDFGASVVALLDPQPGERILDLGCGTGTLAATIAAAGAHVVGVDADAAMVARACSQHPGLDLRHGDAHQLQLRPAEPPFDAVFSNAALHWMTRPRAVLRSVAAVLRPGGRFVGEMGSDGNVAFVLGATRAALAAEGVPLAAQAQPWFYPSPAAYGALLEAAGFEVRLLAAFPRPTPLAGGAAGLRGWLDMFTGALTAPIDQAARERVYAEVEAACRPHLWDADGGRWIADYRRLRFVALAPAVGAASPLPPAARPPLERV